jgi:uncharacterized membrane protein YhhN
VLAVFVFFLVRAELLKKQRQIYLLKPLSTLIVIVIAILSSLQPMQNPTYSIGVMIGLLLALGGDVALMFPHNQRAFALGLRLFLLGHVAYAVIFALLGKFSVLVVAACALLLAIGTGFYLLVKANLGKMRASVITYILVISAMVCSAVSTLASPVFNRNQAVMIVIGAILFYISDLILALTRFGKPWRYNRTSLAFYYSGQLLIALAAGYFAGG